MLWLEGFGQKLNYDEGERQALSIEEIRQMSEYVDFESHTQFHPILPNCSDDECVREIGESRFLAKDPKFKTFRHFAFPNGDYGNREIENLKESGFLTARTTRYGLNGPSTDQYQLKILGATDDASLNLLRAQMTGLPYFLKSIRAKFALSRPKVRSHDSS